MEEQPFGNHHHHTLPPPPTLNDLIIQSSDTLCETQMDMKIPIGWSGTIPILQGPRGQMETPNLLKGVCVYI